MRFLPHQLSFATDLDTKAYIRVTIGFQPNICNSCRNLPEQPFPVAGIYGRTSKISRYYWREITYGTIAKFAEWAEKQGYSDWLDVLPKHQDIYEEFEHEVIDQIKQLHDLSPKYTYLSEESQNDVITKHKIEIINLPGTYIRHAGKRAIILDGDDECSPEIFAGRYFERQGYSVIFTESVPFHTLFAIFMWPVIRDNSDSCGRIVMFGDRFNFEVGGPRRWIQTLLPDDFGSPNYGQRRRDAIRNHLTFILAQEHDILPLFDHWTSPSEELRQYLWVHKSEHVRTARKVISVLPAQVVVHILQYLVDNYWGRYLGWPDLLVHNPTDYFFAEVKSSSDKLSEDQKSWIRGNSSELHLPFKLVKIHRKASVDKTDE